MKLKKMPHLRQGGMKSRKAREAKVVAELDAMRTDDPSGFAAMMKLLARLVVSGSSKKK